ncbi:MAG: response regulator transcription factor [Novosphingobium sp.]
MTPQTTLLLTAPPKALLAELSQARPDWQIVTLGELPPEEPLAGSAWGFIDWLLPEISGLEICRRLRGSAATRAAHLTMVLDTSDREARQRALAAGADDYLPGPLTADVLIDRVESLSGNRPAPAARLRLHHGDLSLDMAAHQARYGGTLITLRPNEFRLLAHFLENPDQVFSRGALIDKLGKHALGIDERTVDVWIGRLRRSLRAQGAPDPLRTVRSLGYVLDSIG